MSINKTYAQDLLELQKKDRWEQIRLSPIYIKATTSLNTRLRKLPTWKKICITRGVQERFNISGLCDHTQDFNDEISKNIQLGEIFIRFPRQSIIFNVNDDIFSLTTCKKSEEPGPYFVQRSKSVALYQKKYLRLLIPKIISEQHTNIAIDKAINYVRVLVADMDGINHHLNSKNKYKANKKACTNVKTFKGLPGYFSADVDVSEPINKIQKEIRHIVMGFQQTKNTRVHHNFKRNALAYQVWRYHQNDQISFVEITKKYNGGQCTKSKYQTVYRLFCRARFLILGKIGKTKIPNSVQNGFCNYCSDKLCVKKGTFNACPHPEVKRRVDANFSKNDMTWRNKKTRIDPAFFR